MLIKKAKEHEGVFVNGLESFVVLEASDYMILAHVVLIVLVVGAFSWYFAKAVRGCWNRRGSSSIEIKKKKE